MSDIFLSWTLFLFAFPIFFGLGASVMSMSPPDFTLAKWCFGIAAFIAAARLGWWLAIEQALTTDDMKVALATFALFGCIGILWVGSLRYVENRQQAFAASSDQGDTYQKQEALIKEAPPQVSSTNQSGGITTGSIGTLNIYPVAPTVKPHVTLGEPIQFNEQTGEGYQTIVDLTVVSPHPVGNLRLTVLEENIKKFNLGRCNYSTSVCTGEGDPGERDGYPSLNIQNAYGTLTLTLVTAEPIRVLQDSLEFEIQ